MKSDSGASSAAFTSAPISSASLRTALCVSGLSVAAKTSVGELRAAFPSARRRSFQIAGAVSARGEVDLFARRQQRQARRHRRADHVYACARAQERSHLALRHAPPSHHGATPPPQVQKDGIIAHQLDTSSAGSLTWTFDLSYNLTYRKFISQTSWHLIGAPSTSGCITPHGRPTRGAPMRRVVCGTTLKG